MVRELITKVHQVLNEVKDFEVGYSTENMDKGYMLIEYKGKRYAVRAVEMIYNKDSTREISDAVKHTQYYI